ncbi:MAG: D-cysteine desulfhydrase family protein [Anaerolineales bacterium]|nr:D-cysteine desulfhydrase family protein [Anaerolineales bacterium]
MADKSLRTLPRLKFAHLPTPIEALPRLSAALGGPRLLVKRDDQTGLAFGGNKTRKLEFLLAEAQANGARRLITAGALQSNHCRQTAAAAARNGFDCTLVLTLPPGSEEPPAEQAASGNLLLDRLLGAQIVWASRQERDQVLQDAFQAAQEAGERPYLIPYGGSNPTGAAAYAYALEELLLQNARPDWIVFPSSSGGTQAGLVLGGRLFNYRGKLLGVSVDEPQAVLQERVAALATQTAALLGGDITFSADEVLVNADYLGGGYGVMGEVEKEAIRLFARTEGLLLDPVYTGRAAAGLIDLVRRGFFASDQTVLFWHTGGSPALFADLYQEVL